MEAEAQDLVGMIVRAALILMFVLALSTALLVWIWCLILSASTAIKYKQDPLEYLPYPRDTYTGKTTTISDIAGHRHDKESS